MIARKKPVEVAGYVNRHLCVVDNLTGAIKFEWWSVRNDDADDDDFLEWNGDSSVNTCPF